MSTNRFIAAGTVANKIPKLAINVTRLYVSVVILSTKDNAKLLQLLKSGFKRTINWNKYLSKVTTQRQHQYSDYLINPTFQGVDRLFLSSEDNATNYNQYFLPALEIKDWNVVVDKQNFSDQPVKNGLRTYDNNRKIATGLEDDYTMVITRLFLF